MRRQGCTQKLIAATIGKDKSVVSRELKRNAHFTTGKYSFEYAQDMASLRKERMKKPRKLRYDVRQEIVAMIAGLVATADYRQIETQKYARRQPRDHLQNHSQKQSGRRNAVQTYAPQIKA
jgi:IS30 family transposase